MRSTLFYFYACVRNIICKNRAIETLTLVQENRKGSNFYEDKKKISHKDYRLC